MGQASSRNDCKDGSCLAKNGQYKASYLKRKHQGTSREGYRYSIGYAPTGTSTCRHSKERIPKGALRIGRSVPNPWDAEAGASDYTQYFMFQHAFKAFERSKCTSKVPKSTKDFQGFAKLAKPDQAKVEKAVAAFAKVWAKKCEKKA